MSFQHRFVQGLGAEKRTHPAYLFGLILLAITLLVLETQAAHADVRCDGTTCYCTRNQNNNDNVSLTLDGAPWFSPGSAPDLQINWECIVPISGDKSYFFKNVNILNGGKLVFYEGDQGNNTTTQFWASSIIVENGGALYAYGNDSGNAFGFRGGILTILLYGKNEAEGKPDQQNQGTLCRSPLGTPRTAGQTPA
jgi:hypothetical protein